MSAAGLVVKNEHARGERTPADLRSLDSVLRLGGNLPASALDVVAGPVMVFDADGRIVHFDRASEEPTGQLSENGRGRYVLGVFVITGGLDHVRLTVERSEAGASRSIRVYQGVASDGTHRLIAWSRVGLTDGEGALTHIVCTGVDISKAVNWTNRTPIEFYGQDVMGHEVANFLVRARDAYEKVQPLCDGRENMVNVESRLRPRDGEERLLAGRCRSLQDMNGVWSGSCVRRIIAQRASPLSNL